MRNLSRRTDRQTARHDPVAPESGPEPQEYEHLRQATRPTRGFSLYQKKNSHKTVLLWSGKRDSNSRRSPWQGDALPLSHSRIFNCFTRNIFAGNEIRTFPVNGNPRPDFRLRSNANSRRSPWQGDALPLSHSRGFNGGNNRARTCDPLLVRQMLSQLSYAPVHRAYIL